MCETHMSKLSAWESFHVLRSDRYPTEIAGAQMGNDVMGPLVNEIKHIQW